MPQRVSARHFDGSPGRERGTGAQWRSRRRRDRCDGLAGWQEVGAVNEEVIGLGRYGKVLTILHSSHIGPENESQEEREEEELRESWTPRFRR
jgi:hypothetical protein